jgi:hypothetical protein
MTEAELFEGGCLCGAVRYRSTARPLRGVICHCSICRRHSGAPALAFVHFRSRRSLGSRRSRAGTARRAMRRGFCAACGSTMAMREEVLSDRVQICVGSLDDPNKVNIDDHVWTSERVAWFETKDDLPRFPRSSSAVLSKALEP